MRHDWQFPGVAGFATEAALASEVVVVAVCARCGQIRAESMTPVEHRRLDLSGVCEPPDLALQEGSTDAGEASR